MESLRFEQNIGCSANVSRENEQLTPDFCLLVAELGVGGAFLGGAPSAGSGAMGTWRKQGTLLHPSPATGNSAKPEEVFVSCRRIGSSGRTRTYNPSVRSRS